MNDHQKNFRTRMIRNMVMFFAVSVLIMAGFSANAYAGHTSDTEDLDKNGLTPLEVEQTKAEEMKFAFLAAAAAFGLGALGAGFAISHVGAAAMGAIAEKPEIAGQAMIFVALGEGIAVFGLITAIMIILKV